MWASVGASESFTSLRKIATRPQAPPDACVGRCCFRASKYTTMARPLELSAPTRPSALRSHLRRGYASVSVITSDEMKTVNEWSMGAREGGSVRVLSVRINESRERSRTLLITEPAISRLTLEEVQRCQGVLQIPRDDYEPATPVRIGQLSREVVTVDQVGREHTWRWLADQIGVCVLAESGATACLDGVGRIR